jgi:Flp pilus assembly protein TadB
MADQKQNGVRQHLDVPSRLVIALTVGLFAVALAVKGLGHDLLLEAGVLLVSVKLIVMAYKNSVANERLLRELAMVHEAVARIERRLSETS